MSRITRLLLQKRAEHNEMMLTNLEEISLHQQEIVKIENIDVHCRHIKILLLQNNIIEKMENLSKLKELEYLNLALNNIAKIEGIEGCESLQKLDLTVNFVDVDALEESVQCLSKIQFLRELYLTGNPCTDWPGCRDYVIAQCHSLHAIDGKDIHPSERIKAIQALPALQEDLQIFIEQRKMKIEQKQHEEEMLKEQRQHFTEEQKREEKIEYSRENRKDMYMKMAQEKEEKDRKQFPERFEVKEPTPQFTKDGKVRQCDEGGYRPVLNQWDDPKVTTFSMKIPKFLDTSLVEVNLNPTYVSVRVKGKLTQLRLEDEIIVEQSTVQRSQTTGELLIKMPKLKPDFTMQRIQDRRKAEEQQLLKKKQDEEFQKDLKEQTYTEKLLEKYEAKALLRKHDETTFDDVPELE